MNKIGYSFFSFLLQFIEAKLFPKREGKLGTAASKSDFEQVQRLKTEVCIFMKFCCNCFLSVKFPFTIAGEICFEFYSSDYIYENK